MDDLEFIVIDDISLEEVFLGEPDELNMVVSEDILVGDYGDIWNSIYVYEDIGHQDILLDIYSPELPVSVWDDVLIEEAYLIPIEFSLFEMTFITDYVDLAWGILSLSAYDISSITDYVDAMVVQTIDIYDFCVNIEYVDIKIGIARSGFDSILINEFLNIARDILYNEINETISVTEYLIIGREVEMLNAQDDLIVLEVAIAEITLDLSFNDFLRSYPFDEETITNIIVEQFENGSEQRRDKWGRTRKRFGINFNPRSKEEIDALRSFYVSRRGPANAFDFISPLDNVDYMVRFEENSLKISRTAYGIYQAQVTLVEVFR